MAEISGNHCGSLEKAKQLIRAAKEAGADAVKTQCYEPDTITLDCNRLGFIVQSGLWQGRTLYEIYGKAHTPLSWHKELYAMARGEGIVIFSSVFDKSSVDLLEGLGCPAYKIASFEIVDIPLIEYVAKTGKPLIISTGLASDQEVVDAARAAGKSDSAFLHCTSEYPGTIEDANLSRMARLDILLKFQHPIGISDHTANCYHVPIAATALGAAIIEKHLKLDDEGEDAPFSLDAPSFLAMAKIARRTFDALIQRPEQVSSSKQFRRSLYAVADIPKGGTFTTDNIRSIRPGYGLPPKMLKSLLGKKAKKAFRRGDPLS